MCKRSEMATSFGYAEEKITCGQLWSGNKVIFEMKCCFIALWWVWTVLTLHTRQYQRCPSLSCLIVEEGHFHFEQIRIHFRQRQYSNSWLFLTRRPAFTPHFCMRTLVQFSGLSLLCHRCFLCVLVCLLEAAWFVCVWYFFFFFIPSVVVMWCERQGPNGSHVVGVSL